MEAAIIASISTDCEKWLKNITLAYEQADKIERKWSKADVDYWIGLLNVQEVEGEWKVFVGNPGYELDLDQYPMIKIDPNHDLRIYGLLLADYNNIFAAMASLRAMMENEDVAKADYITMIDKASLSLGAYT